MDRITIELSLLFGIPIAFVLFFAVGVPILEYFGIGPGEEEPSDPEGRRSYGAKKMYTSENPLLMSTRELGHAYDWLVKAGPKNHILTHTKWVRRIRALKKERSDRGEYRNQRALDRSIDRLTRFLNRY